VPVCSICKKAAFRVQLTTNFCKTAAIDVKLTRHLHSKAVMLSLALVVLKDKVSVLGPRLGL